MREFVTAVKELEKGEEPDKGYSFKVDGKELKFFKPTESQFAIYVAQTGRHSSIPDKIAGVIDFFINVMDRPSHEHLVARLMDREDPFGLDQVEEIIQWMIEEWSGNPTEQSSDSTPSRQSTGDSSTEPVPAST
jgi:hypothetical protein